MAASLGGSSSPRNFFGPDLCNGQRKQGRAEKTTRRAAPSMADDGGEEAPAEEQKPVMPSMPTKIEPPEYIAIQESLIPFFEDITDEQRDRRKFDEQRVEETNLYAQRIEEKLNDEIIKRKEADSALDKLQKARPHREPRRRSHRRLRPRSHRRLCRRSHRRLRRASG